MKLVPYIKRSGSLTPSGFFEELFNDLTYPGSMFDEGDRWVPSVDVMEKDGNLILRAEIPGIDEKDIDLKLEGKTLTLKGERKMESEDKKGSYRRVESYYGSFSRSFRLPDTADVEKVRAEYKNGVLTVTIPQKPEAKPREIPVNVH